MAQPGFGIVAGDVDNTHVADIEHPHRLTHGKVFGQLRTVMQRHVPTTEIDHFGAQFTMYGIQGGGFERDRGHGNVADKEKVGIVPNKIHYFKGLREKCCAAPKRRLEGLCSIGYWFRLILLRQAETSQKGLPGEHFSGGGQRG